MEYSLKRENDRVDELDKLDDEALFQAARKDRSAFTPLYRRYAERVYCYIYSRVRNATDAEDLTAQVFVDALAGLPKYRPQGRFAGWLFTLAYRRCADFCRQPMAEHLSEQHTAGDFQDPTDQAVQMETFYRLERIINELVAEDRELLRLHYAAGLTYREVAEVLGRSEGAIKMAISRIIQKMKSRWEVNDE